jgi:hypothetical protein
MERAMQEAEQALLLLRDELRALEAKAVDLPSTIHLRAIFICITIVTIGVIALAT